MKTSKNFFSNITYITLSSNHVILNRQQVELPRHTKNTVTALIECGVCVPSNYTGFYIKCNLLRNKEK